MIHLKEPLGLSDVAPPLYNRLQWFNLIGDWCISKSYSQEVREEVLGKIRKVQKVSALAQEHGRDDQTIRNWLELNPGGNRVEILAVSRLRRENEAVFRLVGQLNYESEVQNG